MGEEMIERVEESLVTALKQDDGAYARYDGNGLITLDGQFDVRSLSRSAIEASGMNDLLRTASAFIEELKAFGYGETSEKALPGAYDPFVQAVDALKD
jgi:hypothetical protein